jgi:hypothetical protein
VSGDIFIILYRICGVGLQAVGLQTGETNYRKKNPLKPRYDITYFKSAKGTNSNTI